MKQMQMMMKQMMQPCRIEADAPLQGLQGFKDDAALYLHPCTLDKGLQGLKRACTLADDDAPLKHLEADADDDAPLKPLKMMQMQMMHPCSLEADAPLQGLQILHHISRSAHVRAYLKYHRIFVL